MSTDQPAGSVGGLPSRPPRRRHPKLDQFKRTWYFFRRNTLAVIGLGVLLAIGGIAAFAFTQPLNWFAMEPYCLSDYGPGDPGSGYWVYHSNYSYYTPDGPFNDTDIQACNPVCTYEITPPPNASNWCGGLWYKTPFAGAVADGSTPTSFGGMLGPTVNLKTLSPGPMPLGDLSTGIAITSPVYNIYPSLLRGSDWSLTFALTIVGMGAVIGLVVGAAAGFLGGYLDEVLMRLVDIFLSIPAILFVVVVVSALSSTITSIPGLSTSTIPLFLMIVAFAVVWWPTYARIVRGQVLVVREQKYVEAARASGASKGRILVRHIVPNSVQPIFIQFSLDVGTVPLLIGGLQYLGFARLIFPIQSDGAFPEWGAVSALGVGGLPSALGTCGTSAGCLLPWWQLLFPGIALFAFAISVNLLADGLRDALDPRLLR
jgi:peptide/nickel transport system permease protein